MALDIEKSEFHCPLCKAVGNLMLPAVAPPSASELLTSVPGWEEDEMVGQRGWWERGGDAMEVSGDEQVYTVASS